MKRRRALVILLVCVFAVGAANVLYSPLRLATESCLGWDCHVTAPYSVPIWSLLVANPFIMLGLVIVSMVLVATGFYSAQVTPDTRVVALARYLDLLCLLVLSIIGVVALILYPPLR